MSTSEAFFFRIPEIMHILRNPRVHRVLDAIPEFRKIRDSYRHCARDLTLPAAYDYDEAARSFRNGADLNEISKAATVTARHRELNAAANDIASRARNRHDVDVLNFLRTRRAEIAEGLNAGYRECVDEAKELLPALGGVESIEDTLGNPAATVAYSQLYSLANEFEAWMRTTLELLWPERVDGYSLVGPRLALAEYETAWPNFHLEREIRERDSSGNLITVGASVHPWPDTSALLRDIATRDLKTWAPTRAEYEAESNRLHALVDTRRDAAVRSAQSAHTVDSSPQPSHYSHPTRR